MPTVGKGSKARHFPYSPKGQAEAQDYAKATGKPLEFEPSKKPAKSKRGKSGMKSK